jgi:hypothetical protein
MGKLNEIFKFLEANQQWNKGIQRRYDDYHLGCEKTSKGQVIRILHAVSETQAQPRLDRLCEFWKEIFSIPEDDFLDIRKFVGKISGKELSDENVWGPLFSALKEKPGWGQKTSALFVKSCIRIASSGHVGDFWRSCRVDEEYLKGANLYLPVDAVINRIFECLPGVEVRGFDCINDIIKNNYRGLDILLWDDLWFWGFVTQVGGAERRIEWNEAKYWCLWATPKDEGSVAEIRRAAHDFVNILNRP